MTKKNSSLGLHRFESHHREMWVIFGPTYIRCCKDRALCKYQQPWGIRKVFCVLMEMMIVLKRGCWYKGSNWSPARYCNCEKVPIDCWGSATFTLLGLGTAWEVLLAWRRVWALLKGQERACKNLGPRWCWQSHGVLTNLKMSKIIWTNGGTFFLQISIVCLFQSVSKNN